jgi:hypothetical protein
MDRQIPVRVRTPGHPVRHQQWRSGRNTLRNGEGSSGVDLARQARIVPEFRPVCQWLRRRHLRPHGAPGCGKDHQSRRTPQTVEWNGVGEFKAVDAFRKDAAGLRRSCPGGDEPLGSGWRYSAQFSSEAPDASCRSGGRFSGRCRRHREAGGGNSDGSEH